LQGLAGGVETRLHGPDRNPEDLGERINGLAIEVMQDQDRPLLDWKSPHGRIERRRVGFRRTRGRVKTIDAGDAAGRDLAHTPAPSSAVGHPGHIDRDALEPRVEAGGIAQAADLPPRGHERVLSGIARISFIAEDREREAVDGIHSGADDLLERIEVAVAGPVDERPVSRGLDRLPPRTRSTI
jgi:hypothetical protein